MKYKPNSNLFSKADSPFPQRFIELLVFIYIIKNIDKILRDSPNHIKEESSDNETVRSDRFVSTLCRPNLATWRHKVSHEAFGGAQGEEGTPPWLLLATVPGDTPSVSDEPNFFGGGAGSGASTTNSARITGMYFYHPDHLGSITMITDGRGNVLAGGERGGKSHITYRPYGEIFRTDSYGPDISKYKYTGQEEDRESGLLFYKARFYDSKIGRFLQQDSMAFPNQIQGMNRMMYVEGNPVGYRDPSGNNKYIHMFNRIVGHAIGKKFGEKGINKIGKSLSTGINKTVLKGSMWLSNRLSIRRHIKYIAREGTELGNGHRNDRIKEYTKDYLESKIRSLIIKSLRGIPLTTEDYTFNAEDYFEGLVESELIYQAVLTLSSDLAGDILTNIIDNPFDILDYYKRYSKLRSELDLLKKIDSCSKGWYPACIDKSNKFDKRLN